MMGQLENFVNKIICGDALEIMPNLPNRCVNLVFTSPPYNVGIDYGDYDDRKVLDDYISWLGKLFVESWRVLSDGGHIVLNVANTGRQPYTPNTHLLCASIHKKGFDDIEMRGEIIWDKQNITGSTKWGSWLSANRPSLRDRHEYLMIWRKTGNRKGTSTITSEEFNLFTESIWKVTPEFNRAHPSPFPEALAYRVIKLYSFLGEVVLDPCCGSGTTCVVAKKLGRRYIGIDINSEYCKYSENRLSKTPGNLRSRFE